MKKIILIIVMMSTVSLGTTVSAQAAKPGVTNLHHAPDACKSDFIQSLGDVPCETMTETAVLRCDLDRPYYETKHRFRWYSDGVWSQWWLYYRSFRNAPRKACD